MADSTKFTEAYLAAVRALVLNLNELRLLQERVAQKPDIFADYLASSVKQKDLFQPDFDAAVGAVNRLLIAFDGDVPPQKAALFKLL